MVKKITLIILLTLFSRVTFSYDGWIYNKATEFFSERTIDDIAFQKDTAWILGQSGLYKYFNDSLLIFHLDKDSHGNLFNYLSDTSFFLNRFKKIRIEGMNIWILNHFDKVLLRITDNIIYKYKLENFFFIYNFNIDIDGRIWIKATLEDSRNRKGGIFYLEDTNFVEYKLQTSEAHIYDFCFFKNALCAFIRDSVYRMFLYVDDFNKPVKQIYITEENDSWPLLKTDCNFVYIFKSPEDIFIIDSTFKIEQKKIHTSPPADNDDFLIRGDSFFTALSSGLIIYNLETGNQIFLPIPDRGESIVLRYGKITYNPFNNQLWIIRTFMLHPLFKYTGLRIFELK